MASHTFDCLLPCEAQSLAHAASRARATARPQVRTLGPAHGVTLSPSATCRDAEQITGKLTAARLSALALHSSSSVGVVSGDTDCGRPLCALATFVRLCSARTALCFVSPLGAFSPSLTIALPCLQLSRLLHLARHSSQHPPPARRRFLALGPASHRASSGALRHQRPHARGEAI